MILHPLQANSEYIDSKLLVAGARDRLAGEICRESLAWSVAWADRAEIDALNILHATMLAMRRAILGLAIVPETVLVDGNRLPSLDFHKRQAAGEAIVDGDATIAAISAASILAKTTRDRIMTELDRIYPNYAFDQNKGYGTAKHKHRLREHGPCVEHRRSFSPLKGSAWA